MAAASFSHRREQLGDYVVSDYLRMRRGRRHRTEPGTRHVSGGRPARTGWGPVSGARVGACARVRSACVAALLGNSIVPLGCLLWCGSPSMR